MDETRPLRIAALTLQRAEHAVHMARGAGTALHRQAGRLIDDKNIIVFVERDLAQEGAIAQIGGRIAALFGRKAGT